MTEVQPPAPAAKPRLGIRWAIIAAAVYLAGAIALTWPLATHMRGSTASTFQDSRHITWLLDWDAHVLAHHPTGLFQAPNFWPEPDTLTYTDHILGLGAFGAPVIWATGNPYLAHNLLFIASITFAGWAAFLLAFDLTGSRPAALVGGAVFAFAPYWYGATINLSHLQTVATAWMPLSVLAMRRWVGSARVLPLAGLAAAFVMATLTSWYEAVFLIVTLVVITPFFAWEARPLRLRRLALQGLVGGVIVAAVLAPFTLPYLRTQNRIPNFTRNLREATRFAARPDSFLAAPPTNVLYGDLTHTWHNRQSSLESDLFPGVVAIVLVGAGLASLKGAGPDRTALLGLLALVAVGGVLSFGGGSTGARRYLPWTFLFEHAVIFRGLRAPARAHVIALIGMSGLAAFGARRALGWIRGHAIFRWVVAFGLVGLIALEGAAVPIGLGAAVWPTPVHRSLATRPGAILELPTGFRVTGNVPHPWSATRIDDVDYMLMNTANWKPLVNGFSSFEPSSYTTFMVAMATLPDARSLALLRQRGVRTIVIHQDRLRHTPWFGIEKRLSRAPGVKLIMRKDGILVYDVSPS